MNGYLRQSTASQSRLIGPFLDDTDFKTASTGLTIANTDVKLRANGTTLSNKNSGGGTHQVNGMYSLTFDATDTANVGELYFSVVVAGALPVFGVYVVLEEAVYDALFAASAGGYATQTSVDTIDDFLDTEIGAIKAKTDNLPSDPADQSLIMAAIAGIDTAGLASQASVDALPDAITDIVDDALTAMFEAARSEPGQEAPAANATALVKLDYAYKFLRNRLTNDGSWIRLYADNATTVDQKAPVSDDGTTFNRGEFVSGP